MALVTKYRALLQNTELSDAVAAPPAAQTSRELDHKMLLLITAYGERFDCDPFDVTPGGAVRMINSLAAMGWSRSTVDRSFVTSYKRLHRRAKGRPLGADIADAFRQAVKTVRKAKQREVHPFIMIDLFRMIHVLRHEALDNPRVISMIAFSMFTGIRLTSVSELNFESFENCLASQTDEGLYYTVSFRIPRVKGGEAGPPISLRGKTDGIDWNKQLSVCDPIFWLNKYIREKFGFGIEVVKAAAAQNSHFAQRRVWDWKPDSLADRFTQTLTTLGYDRSKFSFHSLRKGLVANKLLLDPTKNPAGVLELLSMIGGWSLSSKSRQHYITSSLARTYVANQFGESISSPELLTVNGYHRFNLKDPWANIPMTLNPMIPAVNDSKTCDHVADSVLASLRVLGDSLNE